MRTETDDFIVDDRPVNREVWAIERANYWWGRLNSAYGTSFPVPLILFNDRLRTCGGWSYGTSRIELATRFLNLEGDKYDKTIAHELCHNFHCFLYNRRKSDHGPHWSALMVTLGFSPDRCHNYQSVVKNTRQRIAFVCPGCQSEMKITKNMLTAVCQEPAKYTWIRHNVCGQKITSEIMRQMLTTGKMRKITV